MAGESPTPDFVFHWEGGGAEWDQLRVVSFHVEDAISAPYEAKIILKAKSPDDEIDPETMIGQLATLRIATLSDPVVRCIHGIIVEASEIGSSRAGMLYEVVLAPPVVRAAHRVGCRIFLEKSTKEIIEAVLTTDPKMKADDPEFEAPGAMTDSFEAPTEAFAFRVKDTARIEDKKTRPYCVQYNESNFDFVCRLLAEEGIAYHFEHHAKAIVMVLADSDEGRTKLDPFDPVGPGEKGRQLDQIRLGGRMRATKFRLIDYNWQKPKLDMKTEAKGDGDESLTVDVYPGLYPDEPKQGEPLVKARLERLQTEARFAQIDTGCRLLGAGTVFAVAHPTARYEGEYLVTRAILDGHAIGELAPGESLPFGIRTPGDRPFAARIECARRGNGDSAEESKFRPALLAKPRINGSQTAMVTAEPSTKGAEIHVGGPEGNENGCVRLKFHWDLETERHDKEPTSCWVRVSQAFAGAGGGSLCHPRVGTEVIVNFQDADPDRPIVVGRVYNGEQPAPANGKGAATVSTLKSMASPGGKVFNEFQFDDTAGEEKVNLTAGKDWNTQVGNNRDEKVKNDSTSTVDVNRTEDTGADRKTHVGGGNEESVDGSEKVTVSGDQEISIGGSQKESIGGDQTLSVGGSESISVGASQTVAIAADRTLSVGAAHSVAVGAGETYTIGAAQDLTVGAGKTDVVGAAYNLTVGATMTVSAAGPHTLNAPVDTTNAPAHSINSVTTAISASGSASIQSPTINIVADGQALLAGATISVTSSGDVVINGASIKLKGGTVEIEGGSVKIAGGTTDITGSVVKVN
ncbi:MAG: type VI secretion system tip protein VgrG [Polyangiaceae bacterium]|nr:type VI secretion system tip protein VgrG [Polyangiaceae bacterium]